MCFRLKDFSASLILLLFFVANARSSLLYAICVVCMLVGVGIVCCVSYVNSLLLFKLTPAQLRFAIKCLLLYLSI